MVERDDESAEGVAAATPCKVESPAPDLPIRAHATRLRIGQYALVTWSVQEVDLGLVPAPSGSGETLVADEQLAMLVFIAWDRSTRNRVPAIATFRGCSQSVFGYPNDEAWPGHRYFDRNIWNYGFLEVVGSDWTQRLTEQNQVAFPGSVRSRPQRHFIVAFHEDVAEFLADDVTVEPVPGNFDDALVAAVRRLTPDI